MDTKPNREPDIRGMLYGAAGEQKFRISRHLPAPDLRPFIKHYWMIAWDLRGQSPYVQEVLQHPGVNLVFERDNTAVYGIVSGRSQRVLEGQGRVAGVLFQPGGFYPLYREPLSRLAVQSLPFRDVFGMDSGPLEQALFASEDGEAMSRIIDGFLRERLPEAEDNVKLVNRIVETVVDGRDITRVQVLAERFALHTRSLQRLFLHYVGVSPKWVIQRSRIHEAAGQAAAGALPDWAALAADLGYHDQAHFIKDFKAFVGVSPEEYARKLRSPEQR
ncbi:helix-turn-helix domain-containing protein [Paenibacillus thiaminolyticus]|uniref:helix-turn-helix domain-containing protein n=1 Tax=Paenibacillus thiaminolyticus TaxID=49283 RepID=UPI0025438C9C|nr:helix-turn-helix domain-containing protein [Paenibacillus thiaminolyticus]WII35896.1 helix-turn-helix domain-containing protein [Paenibacillus thiaminolyticus]